MNYQKPVKYKKHKDNMNYDFIRSSILYVCSMIFRIYAVKLSMSIMPSLHFVIGLKFLYFLLQNSYNIGNQSINLDFMDILLKTYRLVLELAIFSIDRKYSFLISTIFVESGFLLNGLVENVTRYNQGYTTYFLSWTYFLIATVVRQIFITASYLAYSSTNSKLKYPSTVPTPIPLNIWFNKNEILGTLSGIIYKDMVYIVRTYGMMLFTYFLLCTLAGIYTGKKTETELKRDMNLDYSVEYALIVFHNLIIGAFYLNQFEGYSMDTSLNYLTNTLCRISPRLGTYWVYLLGMYYVKLTVFSVMVLISVVPIYLAELGVKQLIGTQDKITNTMKLTYSQFIGIYNPICHYGVLYHPFNMAFYTENTFYLLANLLQIVYISLIDYLTIVESAKS